MDTLHYCMRVNTEDALKSNGMEVFVGLLSHELPVIRSKAARDIMDLRYKLKNILLLPQAIQYNTRVRHRFPPVIILGQ